VNALGWIVVGFVAGALARSASGYNRSTPAAHRVGCLGTVAIGVAGALVGGGLSSWALGEGLGEFGLRSIAVAFVGALVLLLVVDALGRRR
jgi:uncharacterized membrane protein YeaQ/YmgE (transglycosylase-associated protein family)